MTRRAAGDRLASDHRRGFVLQGQTPLAAGFQRRLAWLGFAGLAEAALAPALPLRRGAAAFHPRQTRAEDERDHPHDEQLPEDLANRTHQFTTARNHKSVGDFDATGEIRFHASGEFVKTISAPSGNRPRLHGAMNQSFREIATSPPTGEFLTMTASTSACSFPLDASAASTAAFLEGTPQI